MNKGTAMKTTRLLITLLAALFIIGCGSSSDGGEPTVGTQFIADGGSGGSITVNISGGLTVAGTTTFTVSLRDPSGAPLAFIAVTCESERGIAIIEPSLNGIAQATTDANGTMSGTLGGLLPGSYIFECRAEQGFGLLSRQRISISGTVPDGFAGFPGAAGGNIGGGNLIDQTPIPGLDSDAVVIANSTYTDAGGTTTFGPPIDTSQDGDCDGDITTTDPEPFTFVTYTLSVTNNSNLRIFVDSVSINVLDGQSASSTGTQSKNVEIAPGSSGTVNGLIIDHPNYVAGSSTQNGTYDTIITVTYTTEEGDTFSITDRSSISLADVNNC